MLLLKIAQTARPCHAIGIQWTGRALPRRAPAAQTSVAAEGPPPRVLVTGSDFPGAGIAAALLREGARVTLLQRPDAPPLSGPLAGHTRSLVADVWNPASLSGRARGFDLVLHSVGSIYADPARGLTQHWLNFVSARNVANMCVSDGCPRLVLLSCVRAPWLPRDYVRAKREAEQYCLRVGLQTLVIRAPLTWVRGRRRRPFFWLMTLLGSIPPTMWSGIGRSAPLQFDIFARGVARIALNPTPGRQIYWRHDLRRRNSDREARHYSALAPPPPPPPDPDDEEAPFGWLPPAPDA